ncbi:MAG: hypothetical protein JWO05_1102 [Gemmatimonadetes bacterium]|nr:hypothetical protein [Gemmatimonadota bacterium]
MADRDWEAEMKKIDRQLESVSDKALFPQKEGATPAQQAKVTEQRAGTSTLGVFLRLTLAVALAVGVVFWPYGSRCGVGLFGYLGAVTVVGVGGVWSAVWSWRHRAARAHMLSLLLVLWAILLASMEVLPRTGYARADVSRPVGFGCTAPGATLPVLK